MTQTAMDFSGNYTLDEATDFACMDPVREAPSGAQLRDAALAQVAQGRQEQIQRVRVALLAYLTMAGLTTFTADDVLLMARELGYGEGDTRWLAAVVKGWPEVEATKDFVPSTLPQRHCRPVRIWRKR